MADQWGDPNAREGTSKIEKLIEDAAREGVDFVVKEGWKVLNRPIGSAPINPEQEYGDWTMGKDAPDYWLKMLEEAKDRGLSEDLAKLALLEHDHRMQRRGMGDGTTTID